MKKLVKICLIISAFLAVIGVIAVTAGMAMGARPQDFLLLRIDEDGLIIGELEAIRPAEAVEETGNVQPAEAVKETSDTRTTETGEMSENTGISGEGERFSADEIHSLKIDVSKGSLRIYAAGEGETDIICYTNRSYNICRIDDGTLIIEDDEDNFSLINIGLKNDVQIELYLPPKTMEKMELNLGACGAKIAQLDTEELSLDVGTGSAKIESIRALESADLQVGVGTVVVEAFEGNNLNLDCGIGSLNIVLQGNEADYNYDLDCGIGQIALGSRSFSGMGWENNQDNDTEKNVTADCGVGEIRIGFTD